MKCDRVELTGLLARKDYEQLLCTFLTALENPVEQTVPDAIKTEENITQQQETSEPNEIEPSQMSGNAEEDVVDHHFGHQDDSLPTQDENVIDVVLVTEHHAEKQPEIQVNQVVSD